MIKIDALVRATWHSMEDCHVTVLPWCLFGASASYPPLGPFYTASYQPKRGPEGNTLCAAANPGKVWTGSGMAKPEAAPNK